ncbi:MAG: hypothetical protein RSB29_03205 [Alistipes sp.]
MGKKIIQIILAVAIIALVWVIYHQISTPIKFEDEMKEKKAAVIERIKDLRAAERAYKIKYKRFTGDFDTLANFILQDSITMERKLVDEDDSLALAALQKLGRKNVETFRVAVIDTLFAPRKLTEKQVRELRYIPFTDNKTEFLLTAGMVVTGNVSVPVVECRAPYKLFLDTVVYKQEIINLIDDDVNNFSRYPGVMFGSQTAANNEAGNWED